MFDSIMIGTSSLLAHEKGLRTVGNNLSNVNTPGYKGASLEFANLVDQGTGGSPGQSASSSAGNGLATLGSHINFQAGLDQSTGNPLDLNIQGNGFYTLKRGDDLVYTRNGAFRFDDKGVLVNSSGDHVQALDANGKLADITLDTLERSMPKATSTVKMTGNLNATVATPAVDDKVNAITIYDANGGSHSINLAFTNNGGGDYTVKATDSDGTVLNTGDLKFAGGFPTAATSSVSLSYTPPGGSAMILKFDFSAGVTSLAQTTTLASKSQDGYQAGTSVGQSIDEDGTLNITYSNNQTAKGPRLALANFAVEEDLKDAGGSAFTARSGAQARYGYAGTDDFGSLLSGHLEGSNVDMAEEFSTLILMQRGYQAASHVVSTANDMIQELFDMKGNR
jgi:flagellar hook protein FlgE